MPTLSGRNPENLTAPSIDLRQRAKAANAAALVAMLLPDLSVRFWIYGLDDCIGRVTGASFSTDPFQNPCGLVRRID
ncbi:MAG: hypothetical protein WBV76_22685, partial [Pseudolabrys sp.]